MNNKKVVPMRAQAIGGQPGQQQQIAIEPTDVSFQVCVCGHEFFDLAYRSGVFSSIHPKNPTGKDQPVNVPVLLCRACGWEFGKKVEVKQ